MQGSLFEAQVRVACVELPALPLQLVLRAHPEYREDPVVVVQDDRPLAAILWANRAARAQQIERGMSFAQAKAYSATLHAEVVAEHAVVTAIDELFDRLLAFSPHIEPVLAQPGLFWLDPRGLDGLFGDLAGWAARVHAALAEQRYVSAVVVGFRRGAVWALSSAGTGPRVVRDPEGEQRLAGRVPLERLGIAPALRDELALLDVRTVGQLLALPVAQLRVRYGPEAARLHDFLNGKVWSPLLPRAPAPPLVCELEVDPPDDDHARLLFGLKGMLHGVAGRLAAQQHALTALSLVLELERQAIHEERLETAAPTLDVPQIVDLLRLRLSGVSLPERVERMRLTIEHTPVHPRQVALSYGPKTRDLEAAARAVARLRASFGPEVVTRARLRDTHLPEAAFCFEPACDLRLPKPSAHASSDAPLVRRLYKTPRVLPALPAHEPERWLGRHGAVTAMFGPHRIAGGWWSPRGARERDYYFVETQQGQLLWLFYDRVQRRWFLHGIVD